MTLPSVKQATPTVVWLVYFVDMCAISRYLALSRAISRHLAQFGPFQSQEFLSPAAGVYMFTNGLIPAFELSQAARHRAGCAPPPRQAKCSDGPSEPATLDLSKCGCHGSDLERLKDKAILDVCARLPGAFSTAAGVIQRDVRAMGQRCLMATFFFVSKFLSLCGTAHVADARGGWTPSH